MKTRVATILSVVGVLTAGTAAAVVNTQIFESEPNVAGESSAMLAPDPTTVGLSLTPGSTSTSIAALPGEGTLTEYLVGDAGSVTVDVIGDELRIVSVSAFDGWTIVEQEEHLDEDRVEVSFSSGSTLVEFDADYINGQIVPEIEAEQVTTVTSTETTSDTTSPSASTSTTAQDEYDDEDDNDPEEDDDESDDEDETDDKDEDDEDEDDRYESEDEDDD